MLLAFDLFADLYQHLLQIVFFYQKRRTIISFFPYHLILLL